MISLLWQDSVLSLLDQSVYPQEERWLTCTSLEETVQVLSSGAILEEKIAAIAGAYGLCQARSLHQKRRPHHDPLGHRRNV